MEFHVFCNTVEEKVKDYFETRGEEKQVRCQEIMKNNSTKLVGITILDKACNISPTIYLNDLHEAYENGMRMEQVVDQVLSIYEKNKVDDPIDLDFFTQFDRVRDGIVYKLVHYEKNAELLESVPHMRYLDLAVVFYYIVSQGEMGTGSILIRQEHLNAWKASREDVFCAAAKNTPRILSPEIKSMEEVLLEALLEKKKMEPWNGELEMMIEDMKDREQEGMSNMYVLSNHNKMFGAACILYRNVLKMFADQLHHNLFVLPSSVHEVILIPTQQGDDPQILAQMVKEVNGTQVKNEELLSDHVYYYDRATDEMHLCA